MAREITLNAVAIVSEATLQRALDAFEAQYNIHVNLQYVSWDEYRQDFTNIALHRLAADVAITGTPSTSDLIAMNALRPFSKTEIALLGGEQAFLPLRWRAGMRPGDPQVWAIPLVVDPRILYYRRDLLAKAGIVEEYAFQTPLNMENTIERLHACGVQYPWMALSDRYGLLQRIISWIWAYGGDLFTPDGRRVIFHEENALEGIRAYFRLMRYSSPPAAPDVSRQMLIDGTLGSIVENAYLLFNPAPPEIGCTQVPGGSYVGGSDLVIWSHTRNEAAAVELVRFLTRPDVSDRLLPESFYLPARKAQLEDLSGQKGPFNAAIVQAVDNGGTFPCVPMVGLIEDRLGMALYSIQQELLTDPQADLDLLLKQRVAAFARRTNISLGSLP